MAKSKHTFKKREREKERAAKKIQKEAKRQEVKRMKAETEPYEGEGDPDLEGIVPGPQPRLEE